MPRRSWRRLAGCIVIDLLLAAGLFAADPDFKAGAAEFGKARALVVEDRRAHRVVIAEAGFAVTRSISDFVAARLLQEFELDRSGVLIRGVGQSQPQSLDLVTAVAAALGQMEPAAIRFRNGIMSVSGAGGHCVASLQPDASLSLDRCADGDPVRGPVRAAFQMVEPAHGLLQRDAPSMSYPVQAIAIGRQVTILALAGLVTAPKLRVPGVIVAPFSNDTTPLPDGPEIDSAIRRVLSRVR